MCFHSHRALFWYILEIWDLVFFRYYGKIQLYRRNRLKNVKILKIGLLHTFCFLWLHSYSVSRYWAQAQAKRQLHTHAWSSADTSHALTPRLRLRRQCILGLEAMKSLRRFDRGSLCCLGDWGSLGTAEGEGRDEAGGAGGGWWGDVNRDISYQ